MDNTLISIVGPTAIGKTGRAITLARYFDTDIISSDSRQFYKEMQIGTAVPSDAELASAPHHFIRHISIFDSYSVGDFERDALGLLETLFIKKDVVIMVGGSGLYNDAVTRGLDKFPPIDPSIRQELNRTLGEDGLEALRSELQKRDASYYTQVDLENPHRGDTGLGSEHRHGQALLLLFVAEKKIASLSDNHPWIASGPQNYL